MHDLINKLGGKRGSMRLGKGTHIGSAIPAGRVLIVNCNVFGTTDEDDVADETDEADESENSLYE